MLFWWLAYLGQQNC